MRRYVKLSQTNRSGVLVVLSYNTYHVQSTVQSLEKVNQYSLVSEQRSDPVATYDICIISNMDVSVEYGMYVSHAWVVCECFSFVCVLLAALALALSCFSRPD